MEEFNIKQHVLALPETPGVYVMHDCNGNIIYIGKAKNLKRRVSSYFNNSKKNAKVMAMTEQVSYFEFFLTPTEMDAFVLENSLIKKHTPFYNILLKDGKTYPYIKLATKEKYPTFKIVRKVLPDGAKYFGPYVQKTSATKILEALGMAYCFRRCGVAGIGETRHKKRACLSFDLGNCPAPCVREVSKAEYDKQIEKCVEVLKGNYGEIVNILSEKMTNYAQMENFELAISTRNMISYLKNIDRAVADVAKNFNCDVFALCKLNDAMAICTMLVRGGKIFGVENTLISISAEESCDVVLRFVMSFYENNIMQSNILLNTDSECCEFCEKMLSEKFGNKISVSSPQKGTKRKIVLMAEDNGKKYLQNTNKKIVDSSKSLKALYALQAQLNLPELPKRIECYDISHISGTNKVGSMVVFINGEKAVKMYRKFKIKTVEGNNDFESLKEVLLRRAKELEKAEDVSFREMPNLVLIDGGKGQLSSVLGVVSGTALEKANIASLAKRFEEVFLPNSSHAVMLPRASLELGILTQIRDEAHRFAITFHRTLRTKQALKTNNSHA